MRSWLTRKTLWSKHIIIPAIAKILYPNNVLTGTKILAIAGLNLGELVDLFFDEQSGLVEGYEVSGGIFADAYWGRSFVPAPETLKIGYDVAFVPPETKMTCLVLSLM